MLSYAESKAAGGGKLDFCSFPFSISRAGQLRRGNSLFLVLSGLNANVDLCFNTVSEKAPRAVDYAIQRLQAIDSKHRSPEGRDPSGRPILYGRIDTEIHEICVNLICDQTYGQSAGPSVRVVGPSSLPTARTGKATRKTGRAEQMSKRAEPLRLLSLSRTLAIKSLSLSHSCSGCFSIRAAEQLARCNGLSARARARPPGHPHVCPKRSIRSSGRTRPETHPVSNPCFCRLRTSWASVFSLFIIVRTSFSKMHPFDLSCSMEILHSVYMLDTYT